MMLKIKKITPNKLEVHLASPTDVWCIITAVTKTTEYLD